MINLIEQTQGTDLSSVPQTTKLTLTQPILLSKSKKALRRRHPRGGGGGHNTPNWTKHIH